LIELLELHEKGGEAKMGNIIGLDEVNYSPSL